MHMSCGVYIRVVLVCTCGEEPLPCSCLGYVCLYSCGWFYARMYMSCGCIRTCSFGVYMRRGVTALQLPRVCRVVGFMLVCIRLVGVYIRVDLVYTCAARSHCLTAA
jgi:hypothetical protein